MTDRAEPANTTTLEASDFRMKEYDALREELTKRLEEMWKFEKFALGGAAAIVAWLLTHQAAVPQRSNGWWLPFAFLLLCAARFLAGMQHITKRLAPYLRITEDYFLGEGNGGWQHFFDPQRYIETVAYVLLWLAALAMTLVLPFISFGVPLQK